MRSFDASSAFMHGVMAASSICTPIEWYYRVQRMALSQVTVQLSSNG